MILLAALLAIASEPPRPPAPPRSDEYVYQAGGATLLLAQQLEEPVIAEPQVEREFRRIGIDRACAIYNPRVRLVINAYEPQFRPLLVRAMRARVPAEMFDGTHLIAWGTALVESRKRLIASDIETNGGKMFTRARADLRRGFLSDAAPLPGIAPGGASGAFADWALDKSIARKIACAILRGPPESFGKRKQLFDIFYHKTGTH